MSAPPSFIPFMTPTLVAEPPAGDEWRHEIKYDGYRTQLVIADGAINAYTRNGHDWTDLYGAVAATAGRLRCKAAIIDGEMILQDGEGRSDFASFQKAVRRKQPAAGLLFMAFDLLHLNGSDLRKAMLVDRRALLHALIGPFDPGRAIQFSEALDGDGGTVFAAACGMGLEGVVSKRLKSAYASGPSRAWLKTKCFDEGVFSVAGVEQKKGKPAMALLEYESGEYAGAAFVTLAGAERERFWRAVERLMMQPGSLRVRVRYLKGPGKLRHATVRGIV